MIDVVEVICENARLALEHQQCHERNRELLRALAYMTERRDGWLDIAIQRVQTLRKKEVILEQQKCEIAKLQDKIKLLTNANDTRNQTN